jgi:polysaccharide pyruvyl transferase WcaK-like protein
VLHETSLAVDITGGDSFSDIYGMRRFILGFLRKSLVKIFQKKLVFLPQTYGPFNKTVAKALARHILNNATVVYSRDRDGVDYVKKLLKTRNKDEKIRFLPDVAFVLDPCRPTNTDMGSLDEIKTTHEVVIGLNISGLLHRSWTAGNNMFNLRADYPALISSLIDLFMQYENTAILLVPHVIGLAEPEDSRDETAYKKGYAEQADTTACEKVYEQTIGKYSKRIFLVRGLYNHNETKYIIGLCDFFIGARMHACIAALSQGIPAVGLAYSRKFGGVFESAGVGELVVDLRRHGQDEILVAVRNAFERREAITKCLRRTIPDVQAKILNIFTDFE